MNIRVSSQKNTHCPPRSSCAVTEIGPDCVLTCEAVEEIACCAAPRVQCSERAHQAMTEARQLFLRRRDAGDAIYGVTTGFGPFVRYASADADRECHGAGLLAHLGAGWGENAPVEIVRAAMLLRAGALAQGWSGVRPAVVRMYLTLLGRDIIPAVPEIGSVGASGDLIPLAHIARTLTGEGEVFEGGRLLPASVALEQAGLPPLALDGRDALALTNGTSFLTAYAALAVARAERLIARAETLTGWAYRLLGCRASALDPRLHRARGHAGQMRSAAAIAAEAGRDGKWGRPGASAPGNLLAALRPAGVGRVPRKPCFCAADHRNGNERSQRQSSVRSRRRGKRGGHAARRQFSRAAGRFRRRHH